MEKTEEKKEKKVEQKAEKHDCCKEECKCKEHEKKHNKHNKLQEEIPAGTHCREDIVSSMKMSNFCIIGYCTLVARMARSEHLCVIFLSVLLCQIAWPWQC